MNTEPNEHTEQAGVIRALRRNAREDAETIERLKEEIAHWKMEYEIIAYRLRGRVHPRDNGIVAPDEVIPKLTLERDEARERAAKLAAQLLTEMEAAK